MPSPPTVIGRALMMVMTGKVQINWFQGKGPWLTACKFNANTPLSASWTSNPQAAPASAILGEVSSNFPLIEKVRQNLPGPDPGRVRLNPQTSTTAAARTSQTQGPAPRME